MIIYVIPTNNTFYTLLLQDTLLDARIKMLWVLNMIMRSMQCVLYWNISFQMT